MAREALSDIRVIDLTRVLAGPYCTMMLADFGAEVIKIEQPGQGDGTRQWGPPWIGDQSAYFLSVNRNKKSMTLNLKSSAGVGILKELLAGADVLIENFKVGTMARLGLDYERLRLQHPGLIYCSITGYGQTGPYRDRPGYDFMIQAQGGIMSITGPVEGQPYKVGVAIADITAGLYAGHAILAALHHRQRTGQGQYIDVALLDSQIGWLANVAHNYFATGELPARYGNAHANIVPYETFPTRDGHLALAVGSDGQYQRMCHAIGREDLCADERFQSNSMRVNHRDALIPLLRSRFSTKTTDEWLEILLEAGVPAGPINDIPTALSDPQVVSRGMVQEIDHEVAGTIQLLGPVAKLSHTPAKIRNAPPVLGRDTDAILADQLGHGQAEIEEWRAEGVI